MTILATRLEAELHRLRVELDRGDPLAETALALVEAAALGVAAVERARLGEDPRSSLLQAVGAARAAVVAASWAASES
ncbi:hypothetical protein D5S17_07835 [Pseudonocardiaceae bacterium YIM PH 21723]|nr:hypothetical protein D5S17_07835 [Pseudonocardiaceae bacterium YIM PH 21723]